MPSFRLLGAAALLAFSSATFASSLAVTTDSLAGALSASADTTSDASSSLRDSKLVRAARDDAASFVASEGAIRGARLEAALVHIRTQAPQLQASDLQLAEAILAL
ncbi:MULTISPECIES: DUF2388 domain-containing protein [Pseudomonas]|uniref:DUF2388 domain-containing protein n=1 Tax=Pseudomonadaceae TaxID=135621 RepID=UPI00084ABABB|nr:MULTISPECIES: DUF2388 domain-containing protein [Pseudomonas]OEC56253.1 holliday junction resolvasome, helicase subunit [Pseudomonas sp. ENNP23]